MRGGVCVRACVHVRVCVCVCVCAVRLKTTCQNRSPLVTFQQAWKDAVTVHLNMSHLWLVIPGPEWTCLAHNSPRHAKPEEEVKHFEIALEMCHATFCHSFDVMGCKCTSIYAIPACELADSPPALHSSEGTCSAMLFSGLFFSVHMCQQLSARETDASAPFSPEAAASTRSYILENMGWKPNPKGCLESTAGFVG